METESKVVSRKRCPKCAAQGNDTSGNNLAVYDDGHSYCYACEFYVRGTKMETPIVEETPTYATEKFRTGEIQALPHRRINEKTARQYGYQQLLEQRWRISSVRMVHYRLSTSDMTERSSHGSETHRTSSSLVNRCFLVVARGFSLLREPLIALQWHSSLITSIPLSPFPMALTQL